MEWSNWRNTTKSKSILCYWYHTYSMWNNTVCSTAYLQVYFLPAVAKNHLLNIVIEIISMDSWKWGAWHTLSSPCKRITRCMYSKWIPPSDFHDHVVGGLNGQVSGLISQPLSVIPKNCQLTSMMPQYTTKHLLVLLKIPFTFFWKHWSLIKS